MTLKTRPPTGIVPYPLVLLEGGEKSGKSWACALLSTSPKVGQTYWLDLNEGAADEYGAIPGTRYLVVEHDGTYAQVLAAVEAVKDEARRAKEAGEPPVVLVIDSMTALWDGLKDWITERAVARAKAKGKRASVEDITITTDLWNDATSRYRRLMTHLLTFPGIVVVTARGKEVAEMANGRPVEGSKVHKVEAHKTLAYDATVWVRMSRTASPLVVGARSVHVGLVPGKDDPLAIDVETPNLLEWLIFEALRVDVAAAAVRDLQQVTGGELTEDETDQPTNVTDNAPAREPRARRTRPATDQQWFDDWKVRLRDVADMGILRGLYAEAVGQYKAGKLGESDNNDAQALLTAAKAEVEANIPPALPMDAAAPGAWTEQVAPIPVGGAA